MFIISIVGYDDYKNLHPTTYKTDNLEDFRDYVSAMLEDICIRTDDYLSINITIVKD